MPIKPIDLQTLFMQMGQVSRQQAMEKDGAAARQIIQGTNAEQKAIEESKSVHLTEDDEKESTGIKNNEEKKSSSGDAGGQRKPGKDAGEPKPDGGKEIVKDPELGGHIDITG